MTRIGMNQQRTAKRSCRADTKNRMIGGGQSNARGSFAKRANWKEVVGLNEVKLSARRIPNRRFTLIPPLRGRMDPGDGEMREIQNHPRA
jgi:hypothetical protein